MSSRRKPPVAVEIKDEDIDLNPLIDVITMLIIFFILGGKLTQEVRSEQITVPPTKTATKIPAEIGWDNVIINVFGNTQIKQGTPSLRIRVGNNQWESTGIDDYTAYTKLREMLDKSFDRAEKYDDPKGTGMKLPKVLLELRGDANTQYRVIQEIQQIVTDSIIPSDKMLPRDPARHGPPKPFVNINFTSRNPMSPTAP